MTTRLALAVIKLASMISLTKDFSSHFMGSKFTVSTRKKAVSGKESWGSLIIKGARTIYAQYARAYHFSPQ